MAKIILNSSKFYRPSQKEIFMECSARFIGLKAGRRFGKSQGARRWLLSRAFEPGRPDLPCMWCSPKIEHARKVFDKFYRENKRLIKYHNISRRQIILRNGREIFFAGVDKPESIEGEGLWAVVLDECRHIKNDIVWNETISPMLSDAVSEGGGKAVLISTPKTRLHWFSQWIKKIQRGEMGPDYAAFVRTTLQGGNIPQEEILRAKANLPPEIYKRNYEAEEVSLEGMVYPEFTEHNILKEIPNWFQPYYITAGVDFGATEGHPTVFVTVAQDSHGLYNIVLDEAYLVGATAEIIEAKARELVKKYGIRKMFCDHNRPDWVQRLNVIPGLLAVKAKKDILAGVEVVRELLFFSEKRGRSRLYFLEQGTKRLQEEIENYMYKEGTQLPDKAAGKDDGMDALRYNCIGTAKTRAIIKDFE